MNTGGTIYAMDTSALIDARDKWYPVGCFPTLWSQVERLTTQKRMIAPDVVLDELERLGSKGVARDTLP